MTKIFKKVNISVFFTHTCACLCAYFLLDIIFMYIFANVEHFMMSYAEKPEDITREEWMEKLNNVHIQRADMNRLIMNYLVTGR